MIALGLDISLVSTGIVILKDGKQLYRGVIRSKPQGQTPKDEIKRIIIIVNEITDYIDEWKPDLVVIEGLAFMARNSTALVQLGALNYMVRKELYNRSIEFVIVAPSSLKKFVTGRGNAQKDQVMLEIYKRYGVSILDNNEADAYGLARIGVALLDKESKITNTQKQVVTLVSSQIA